jgi:hypothetical protein
MSVPSTSTMPPPTSSDFLSTSNAGRLQPGQQTAGSATGGESADNNNNSGSTSMAQSVVALFKRSSHPTAAVFHVIFKIAAIIIYLLANAISSSFIGTCMPSLSLFFIIQGIRK